MPKSLALTKNRIILFIAMGLCLVPFLLYAQPAGKGIVSISDGSTTVFPYQIDVTGATVSDGGDGTADVAITGGSGDITAVGTCADGSCGTEGGNDIFPFIYEGTADTFETNFAVTDPTTPDKTITFPNATGTVAVSATAPVTLSATGVIAIPQATTSVDGYVVQADWDSWTDHVADNSQAHSDYVINTGDTITGALTINDNNAAGSTLLTIGDATDADSVAIFGDLTVTGGDITLGTSKIFSGGDTTSLNLIDAIDATTETTLEGALDIAGEVTSTGMSSTVIADSVAVSSWNLTTPTITTSLTTSTPTTLTAAELDRLDGLTSAIIDDDKIDTAAELDTIVADENLLVETEIDASSELAAIMDDETGTAGKLVFDTSPTLVTPTLGVAAATSINKVAITAPATAATLTIIDGKTLTATNTVNLNTMTDENLCNYEATGTYINCDLAVNAGTDLTADLEEEVTEGSLADSTIISADIKNGEIVVADTAITAGRSLTWSTNDMVADSELYTDFKGITIETPTDADNFFAFEAPIALTVTRVHGIVEAATSAVLTWQECDTAGDNCATIESVTADVDGVIVTSGDIDNASIDAGDIIRLDVGTVTGTVGQANSTITFTKND